MTKKTAAIETPREKRGKDGAANATRCVLAESYETCLVYLNGENPAVKTENGWVCLRHAVQAGLITREQALDAVSL